MFSEMSKSFTYDDLLIQPNYSEVMPHEVKLDTRFSRNISLSIPLVSAAMDTVTEHALATVMAQEGGIGVIHKNLSIEEQAAEVLKVKRFQAGMITNPITIKENATLAELKHLIEHKQITGVPVVDENNKLVGIITNRDMRFEHDRSKKIREIMTTRENLIVGKENITQEEAKKLLHQNRIEKLPIVDASNSLIGLITIRDIISTLDYPLASYDSKKRLRVAAAMGVSDRERERAHALIKADVDALVVDTAHGHTKSVMEMVKWLRTLGGNFDIVAGNIATEEAAIDLIKAGVDGVKVGIGPGSICTTRVVAGIGVPQASAVTYAARALGKAGVPLIADGGIKYSGDIVKALALGASTVMAGSLFAGTDEAPGEMILYQGRYYKSYRGMGSIGAMKLGSKDRYFQSNVNDNKKLVPEGVEGQIPYRGPLRQNIFQLLGGLRSGMGYIGAKNLMELQAKSRFTMITASSLRESHPHDVMITKESPNYQQG